MANIKIYVNGKDTGMVGGYNGGTTFGDNTIKTFIDNLNKYGGTGLNITGHGTYVDITTQNQAVIKPAQEVPKPAYVPTWDEIFKPLYAQKPLKGKKICLDAGHGGKYQNYGVNNAYREADFALWMALTLKPILENLGASVLLTRTSDATVEINDRCAMANKFGADIFISLHTNAAGATASGFLVCYSVGRKDTTHVSMMLEELTKENAKYGIGKSGSGIIQRKQSDGKDYYGVIRITKMEAMIIEYAYHTNPKECDLLLNNMDYKYANARATISAILRILK